MNIYLNEMKSLLKSTIIWTLSLVALAAIYFSVYPSIVSEANGFKDLLSGYPAPVRAALGISLDNITSILGFYSMILTFITLCAAIQAMIFGTSILSREARERTADFLLVKPVSRSAIVTSKLLAALTMLAATNIFYSAASALLASTIKTADFDFKMLLMINLTLVFLQLIFLAMGMFISVFFNKLKSVLPISLGTVFGFFFIGALIATGNDDKARYLSPFKYFETSYILKNASYELPYLITGAVIIVAAIVLSYIIYAKKDIHSLS